MCTDPRSDMLTSRCGYRSLFRSDWLAIAFHYVVLLWVFHGMLPWLLFMTLCKGFMTGIVVFSTHYGEDILENGGELALVEQTALTSRNITGGYVTNLLTGYVHKKHVYSSCTIVISPIVSAIVRSKFFVRVGTQAANHV